MCAHVENYALQVTVIRSLVHFRMIVGFTVCFSVIGAGHC